MALTAPDVGTAPDVDTDGDRDGTGDGRDRDGGAGWDLTARGTCDGSPATR